MTRKKDLKADIKQLRNEVNNLRNKVTSLDENQKIPFGVGKEPAAGLITCFYSNSLIYDKATTKEILLALLKHLNLEIAELTQKTQAAFKLAPIKKGSKKK